MTSKKLSILIIQRSSLVTEDYLQSRSVTCRVTEPIHYCQARIHPDWTVRVIDEIKVQDVDIKQCDIVIFCKHLSNLALNIATKSKELGKKIIYDIDDLVYAFEEESVASKFNSIDRMKTFFNLSDHIVISTPTLQKELAKDIHLKDFSIIRTGFNFRKYKKKLPNFESKNILFTNADILKLKNFKNDFFSLINTFFHVNKNLNFDIFADPNDYISNFTKKNYLGTVPWEEHKQHLLNNDYRFAVIPLGGDEDSKSQRFHQCKTAIKYLEYGAMRIPGIYSKCHIYTELIEHEQTGLLVNNTKDEWENALDRLNKDTELRKRISNNAYQDVIDNHSINKTGESWLKVIKLLQS